MNINDNIKELHNAYQIINKIKSKPLYAGLLNSDLREIVFPEYNRIKIDVDVELTSGGIKIFNKSDIEFNQAKDNWGNISCIGIYNTMNNNFNWIDVSGLSCTRFVEKCSTIIIQETQFSMVIPYHEPICNLINHVNLLNYWFE